jgi:hypothetical protein
VWSDFEVQFGLVVTTARLNTRRCLFSGEALGKGTAAGSGLAPIGVAGAVGGKIQGGEKGIN